MTNEPLPPHIGRVVLGLTTSHSKGNTNQFFRLASTAVASPKRAGKVRATEELKFGSKGPILDNISELKALLVERHAGHVLRDSGVPVGPEPKGSHRPGHSHSIIPIHGNPIRDSRRKGLRLPSFLDDKLAGLLEYVKTDSSMRGPSYLPVGAGPRKYGSKLVGHNKIVESPSNA